MLIVAKPETLAAGVHKPSLLPIAQLKKYAPKTSNYMMGPHIIGSTGSVLSLKREYSQAKSVMTSGVGNTGENKAKRIKGTDSSDFVSFSDDTDMPGDRIHDDRDKEVKELKTTVAELRDEISRWKTVAQKLKAVAGK